ncbi:hypothetical protein HW509_10770 [Asaia spathodeae]|uniref:hypothetical protein n=1 Tax=Asaia spathodeae TaxID=657016 RepID=UPI002FC2D97C
MVADYAFPLTTKPINDLYDVLFFGDGRKPLDTQLVVEIQPHFAQEPSGPSAARDTNMNVGSSEGIKDHPGNDLAILLNPHLRERRMEKRVQPVSQKARYPTVMLSGEDDAG